MTTINAFKYIVSRHKATECPADGQTIICHLWSTYCSQCRAEIHAYRYHQPSMTCSDRCRKARSRGIPPP